MTKTRRIGALMAALAACSCTADQEAPASADVDFVSSPGDLVIGSWNLEYFGSPTMGVPDDALQVANAATVIARLEPDVLGLEEIADASRFEELKRALPEYAGLTAVDPDVTGGAAAYPPLPAYYHPALLVKRDRAQIRSAKVVAGIDVGRPPLEAALTIAVGGQQIDLVVIVAHFYPFAEPAAWSRRRDTGDRLKAYLDTNHRDDMVAVIGDFNDDVDTSILEGWPTPYAQLRDDSAHYLFTTQGLSVAGQGTTVDWPSTIDHHLVTNELAARFVSHSAWVERPPYIANYRNTTSDHYPVTTRYHLGP